MERLCVPVFACLVAAAPARAERIAVGTADHALVAALAEAFVPAGMTIVGVSDAPPAAIGELTAFSRTIAEREHAAAVVWLLVDREGATLVAYDREIDRVLVRPLPYAPPLSPESAAETARAARTMLRALKLADEPEPQQPSIVVVEPRPAPELAPRPWPNVTAIGGFGGRYGRLGEDGVIEGQLAALLRPDAFGVMAMVSVSPRAALASPALIGSVSDNSLAIAARIPLQIAPRIWAAGYAGPAMHAVKIEGTLGAEAVSELRFDFALRAGAASTYALSNRLDLGLNLSMDTLVRRQRYEVPGGQVLVMPRLQVSVGIMFAVRVM